MFKKYRLGFDFWGLLLFLIIMIPNFIWFVAPAPNDILRADSITPIIDGIGSIAQLAFVASICLLLRKEIDKIKLSKLIIFTMAMIATYFVGWILYYCGMANTIVIALLTIPPCMAFIIYAVDRKNVIAIIPAVIFTICHVIYGFVNFVF
ncbi:hypothetical protein LJC01_01340 [Clostridiaceae bacterium OttesenSCG-928-D20]|nr:hypothetical protein [Clostridiaceae bacterium OttesenSCG-928-D20]